MVAAVFGPSLLVNARIPPGVGGAESGGVGCGEGPAVLWVPEGERGLPVRGPGPQEVGVSGARRGGRATVLRSTLGWRLATDGQYEKASESLFGCFAFACLKLLESSSSAWQGGALSDGQPRRRSKDLV